MQITILIEPIEGGRFRARAGEPFTLSAEGGSPDEATRHLETLIRSRLNSGSRLAVIDVGNGVQTPQPPFYLPPIPEDDWFANEMRAAIAENRRLDDEAENRRLDDEAGG